MCHIVLLLPVLGLAVFWVWPWPIAVPAYALILAVSAVAYKTVLGAMRLRPMMGPDALLHEVGTVVGRSDRGLSVRVHSELWRATSPDALKPADLVEVTDVQGLTLEVRPVARAVTSREHTPDPANGAR